MPELFGTNGVRGITNKELGPELALGLGKAIGTYFGRGKKILTARDVRAGGDMLIKAVESGLLSTGIRVYEAGQVPIPAHEYGVRRFGYDGGVVVTASHNPPEFNGIKVIQADGIEADVPTEEEIERIFFGQKFFAEEWRGLNYDTERDDRINGEYIRAVLSRVDVEKIKQRKFKIVIDGGNSVGSITMSVIAKALGCEVHEINAKQDPLFPARNPEPTPESLANTAKQAKKLGIDFGVAQDGDADRAVFIDSNGEVQHGDRAGVLLAYWVSQKEGGQPKTVVTPFSSSNLTEEFLTQRGIQTRWTRVGSRFVSRVLVKEGGIAGFEDNGGFIYPKHQYVRDGAMAFALMAEFLASESRTSAEIFGSLPKYYTSKIKVPFKKETDIAAVLSRVTDAYSGMGEVADTDDDGIKFSGKDFWFIVRRSGTEPVIRISVETRSEPMLRGIVERLKALVAEKNH
jgi:phosphomannomutase/phosphoglucomutase